MKSPYKESSAAVMEHLSGVTSRLKKKKKITSDCFFFFFLSELSFKR